MKLFKLISFLFICAILASCSKSPDVLFTNGKIYTLDNNNTIAEAIAVKDGKIIETGKSSELKQKFNDVKTIDLKGKTVVPGFIDAEGNLMEFSRQLSFIDLRNAKSLNEIVQLITEKVKTAKPGEWVGGFGWDPRIIPSEDLAKMNHKVLDNISTEHFIYIVNILNDAVLVNKKVLDQLKITKETPDPEGGSIGFDEQNNPNGFFYDSAQEMVIKILPQPTETMVRDNVMRGISELHKYGITGLNDANLSEEIINVYKKLVDENKFNLRLYAMIPGKGDLFAKYIQSGPEDYKDRIKLKCMFLEYDGYFSTQDAAMINDYNKDPRRKTPFNDEFDIIELCKQAFEKDFQISVKAVGDRAVNATLNALDSAYRMVKPKAGRNRLEYISFIQPQDINKIKQLEIIPSVRPEVTLEDILSVSQIINTDNSKNLGLWNILSKQNNMIISGTDFPYHMINPLYQMYVLATGMPFDTTNMKGLNNSTQKLSVMDALKSFTIWSAYAAFDEEQKGSLEKGKMADFVVLSDDIIISEPKVLLTTKLLMTVFRGEVVYENKIPAAFLN